MFAKEMRGYGILNAAKNISDDRIDQILANCECLISENEWDITAEVAALLIDSINHIDKLQSIINHEQAMSLNHVLNGNQVKNAFYSNQKHAQELMEAAIKNNDSALLIEKANVIAGMLDGYNEADSNATYKLVRIA